MPAPGASVPTLTLYTRPGCHLCDLARIALEAVLAERVDAEPPALAAREVDIESDPELRARYAATIPVITLGRRELRLATDESAIRRFVEEALDQP